MSRSGRDRFIKSLQELFHFVTGEKKKKGGEEEEARGHMNLATDESWNSSNRSKSVLVAGIDISFSMAEEHESFPGTPLVKLDWIGSSTLI